MTDDELKLLFDGIRQEVGAIREDNAVLRQEFGSLRQEFGSLRQEFGSLRQEFGSLQEEFGSLREEFAKDRQANAQAHDDTRRHFDIVTEATRNEIRLVAEAVMLVDQKLDREAADIRQEMRTGFADTQAMIKFSHAELDRRIRAVEENYRSLEDALVALQTRVERLEGSTH